MRTNKLTEELIKQGYTAENHPDYVKVGGSGATPTLDNFEGGFIYKRSYLEDKVFKTPCGIKCRYSSTFDNLFYNGFEYTYENGLALINCPKGCKGCRMRHEGIRKLDGVGKRWCAVSMTEEPYEYEGSVEELNDATEREKEEKKKAFMKANPQACIIHMSYDGSEWHHNYDARTCARQKCTHIASGTCPIFPANKEKGNVYYDLEISYKREEDKNTLFEGKIYTELIKGKQFFDAPVSLTLAKIVAKKHTEEIIRRERSRHSRELFFSEYHGKYYEITIKNIRAAKKEVRDLDQDIADMAAGIRVYHHRDHINRIKKAKAIRKTELADKKKLALRKKLIKTGYDSFDTFSLDKKHADKWFSQEELKEIENERKTRIRAEYQQLNVFDLLSKNPGMFAPAGSSD